jgi:hypothetical protein
MAGGRCAPLDMHRARLESDLTLNKANIMKPMIISKAELARSLGISKPRVSQFLAQGMPVRFDGRLDTVACLKWLAINIAPPTEGVGVAQAARMLLLELGA